MSAPLTLQYCLLLKIQEQKVRKIIVYNDYMTFLIKLKLISVLEVVMRMIILILQFVYQIELKH